MTKKKKKKTKLPDMIIPITCSDKIGWTEKWTKNRNLLNLPHSFRGILAGPPSSGKTTTIKNIILRADPEFEEIIVVHYSSDDTTEWDDVNATVVSEIPDPHDIDSDTKKLLIIEDLDLKSLNKIDMGNLNRLYGYTSSHKNLSIVLTCQNVFDSPPCSRRVSNLFIIWRQPDLTALAQLAARTGLKSKDLLNVFKKHIHDDHDSFWIDLTRNSPAKYRINGYEVIDV